MPDSSSPASPASPATNNDSFRAYLLPYVVFVALGAISGLVHSREPAATVSLWRSAPELWIFPLQTLICAGILIYYRRAYPPARLPSSLAIFGVVVGLVAFAVWISPQAIFGAAPRIADGFDPTRVLNSRDFADGGNTLYWATLALRFLRLVIVVPILEEIFWRGFLLRVLIREDFLSVPFGSWTPLSFLVVTIGFMLEHSYPDYPAALITGALFNLVAVRTRNLPACIAAHAVTNALLGAYVMSTHQWGFW